MSKPLHKFRLDSQHRMYLDGKMLKGVQAMQMTMDVKNPTLAILNLVFIAIPSELEHDKVEVKAEAAALPQDGLGLVAASEVKSKAI